MIEDRLAVVIVAAGSASRMGGIDKQLREIGGIPVVVRSILAFDQLEEVAEIVVVAKEEALSIFQSNCIKYHLHKVRAVLSGGATRQQSVEKGIAALSSQAEYYAIHDGARPFADAALIRRCLEAAKQHGAALPAVKVTDTIKIVAPDGSVESTPKRELLYAAQTPQIFSAKLYLAAAAQAKAQGLEFTDDCQLIEQSGGKVFLSEGSYRNRKITTPEDLVFAEELVKEERRKKGESQ